MNYDERKVKINYLKSTISIRITSIGIFIFISLVTALVAIGLQYEFSKSMTHSYTLQLYNYAANDVSEHLNRENDKTVIDSALLANFNDLVIGEDLHPDAFQLFANAMTRNDVYNSIYVGFPNGDLTQLVSINKTLNNRDKLKANVTDRWVLVTISNETGTRQRKYQYLDKDFNLRNTRYEKTNYDATQRPWYQEASFLKVNKSDAYLYAQSRTLGQTYSVKIPNSDMVLGLDVTLNSLSEILKSRSTNKDGMVFKEAYIFQENGDVLASNKNINEERHSTELSVIPYSEFPDLIKNKDNFDKLHDLTIDGIDYYAYISPIGRQYGDDTYLAIIIKKSMLLSGSMRRVKISMLITAFVFLMLLPLSYFFISPVTKPIKALVIEAEKIKNRQYDQIKPVHSRISEIQELNDSMESMYSAIETHEADQAELMESFIKLIAQAIDDKSPYTAGHCNRVPELGLMLADAAEASVLPPFENFKFNNKDEHREFRIAAWLHDCGKITTPENIVDKGTKLEAIYNRIHEIRMRFEVLWRDAEIYYYQQILLTPEKEKYLKEELIKKQYELKEDFEFVAESNVGTEWMSEESVVRLDKISKKTWNRYFDDRLGLSPIEELNLTKKSVSLPVIENLIMDKKEHIIQHSKKIEFDPKLGIKMDVPDHLYNQGELYNLSIKRGTLTKEDRFKINQHIISTIKMLEELPFPPELSKVPRYASTHHETLKGTGYPRKLNADDLSIPERILVIADVFEALTSSDRPYKKAKPLGVSIDILHKMALDQHIDMDLFKLFLTSGIYFEYAVKFLDDKQIDDIDINQYLS